MNIYLVEHADQAGEILDLNHETQGKWIALGPSAMHYLSKRDIPYSIPEDYCSRETVENVCLSQYKRLDGVCRELDERLWEKDPFLEEWGIRPFGFYLWQLSQLMDGLVSRTKQLEKILEVFRDAHYFVHLGPPQCWGVFGIGFSPKETLWGRILSQPGWDLHLHFLPQREDNIERKQFQNTSDYSSLMFMIKKRLGYLTHGGLIIRSLLKSLQREYINNIRNIWNNQFFKRKGTAIVMLNSEYEWASILPILMQEQYPVYFLSEEGLIHHNPFEVLYKAEANCTNSCWELFIQSFGPSSINYVEVIRDRFDYIVKNSSAIARRVINYLEHYSASIKLRTMITSSGSNFICAVAKQFCRKKNIKVLCWQYGATWHNEKITQRSDLLNLLACDKMLLAGDSVKSAYHASTVAQEEHCELVSVGMPSLTALSAISIRQENKLVRLLWPFGGYYGNGWYCGFSPPHNDRIYYQEQMVILKKIEDLLTKHPRLSVTIKLYPNSYLNENPPWVDDLVSYERIKIIYDQHNFVDLLGQHNVVIIDSPTTTLLQAVATKLPVFVLMSVIRWSDEAIKRLRRRASVAAKADDLMTSFEDYVQDGTYKGETGDQDFLEKYGIHNNDAMDRALSIVRRSLYENSGPRRQP